MLPQIASLPHTWKWQIPVIAATRDSADAGFGSADCEGDWWMLKVNREVVLWDWWLNGLDKGVGWLV